MDDKHLRKAASVNLAAPALSASLKDVCIHGFAIALPPFIIFDNSSVKSPLIYQLHFRHMLVSVWDAQVMIWEHSDQQKVNGFGLESK